ncbi:hypothetical protein [Planomonospora venezuelensis]|uniref:DivIVA domain-containing protein n=1 Tax=Planomonospora venezuelensis TaxID=1999 RepID=A0A841D3C3_PLAVE|nr:hypothetical protein [Planomonospora venezuelensis]MBB5962888.1 hypothetical protein [Planomonospora venezuelensis]GIN04505.1 hypothetical protein Pve01_61630 [Planomonospora venezuelensis]
MLVVLSLAALAILAGVVLVAMGKGGELTEFAPDVPPLALPDAGHLGAVDFMALQLPVSLVGYHTQSVDETLQRAATALSERDTRIAVLEQRVSELLAGRLQARQEAHAGPSYGPLTEHRPRIPAQDPEELRGDGSLGEWRGDTAYPDPAHQDPAHQDPAHSEPAHQDPPSREAAHQDPAHQEPAHQDPPYRERPAGDETPSGGTEAVPGPDDPAPSGNAGESSAAGRTDGAAEAGEPDEAPAQDGTERRA